MWKHPHARGEDSENSLLLTRTMETPPRTWGRLHILSFRRHKNRNTPTHVGKTKDGGGRSALSQKHPHARGEDGYDEAQKQARAETPPRTWGRLGELAPADPHNGNTPTHVGKTPHPQLQKTQEQKHPHARGEDQRRWRPVCAIAETPPRTWGRRIRRGAEAGPCRNTPTHVGKTRS